MRVGRLDLVLSKLTDSVPGGLPKIRDFESRFLRETIESTRITTPVFICGLARSGTTILLETLARQKDTACHQYKDFPFVFFPVRWSGFQNAFGGNEDRAEERPHSDGIYISSHSPEAMDEPIWMSFFPSAHNPRNTNVVADDHRNTGFENFFRDHVRKIMILRSGNRYVAKGNYLLSRIEYLKALFPDARFVIPVREPVFQVSSSMRQHELFRRLGEKDHNVVEYMRRNGHFEFGLDRRPINFGKTETTNRILSLWDAGKEVEGWLAYWADAHRFLVETLRNNPNLLQSSAVLQYEDLCASPETVLSDLFRWLELGLPDRFDELAASIHQNGNRQYRGDEVDVATVARETNGVLDQLQGVIDKSAVCWRR